jgi:hypothetical protein
LGFHWAGIEARLLAAAARFSDAASLRRIGFSGAYQRWSNSALSIMS